MSVCVTPVSYIGKAVMLALDKKATIATFGDVKFPERGNGPCRARANVSVNARRSTR